MEAGRGETCCFTGHRELPEDRLERIRSDLRSAVGDLYELGVNRFVAGGAIGFDTLAAETVVEFKKQHSDVELVLILPCKDQSKTWSAADKARYEAVLACADRVECLFERYVRGCMHIRNRRMVDMSSYCIAYRSASVGGSAYTCAYAEKSGLTVINLARN